MRCEDIRRKVTGGRGAQCDSGTQARFGGGAFAWCTRRENIEGLLQMSDWASYGRVDADGTVWVKTAAGERVVGSWQAGTPEEGLAHFARRYEDLLTEVVLLETRLSSGAADASHTLTTAKRLRSGLDEAHVVGDVDGLGLRLDALIGVAQDKSVEAKAARDAAR